MQTSDSLQRLYEELANRYARQGEARQRDHCLVLAADAALSAGQPDQAERIRKRLLLTNPHHLVRPFASMAEAMQSPDVQDYVADLRRQWPPEMVEKLVRQTPGEEKAKVYDVGQPVLKAEPVAQETPLASKPVKEKKSPASKTKEALTLGEEDLGPTPATPAGFWAALLLFGVGLVLAVGFCWLAFGGPLLDLR